MAQQYQEKDPVILALEANRRKLTFELRETLIAIQNRARAYMEAEFYKQLANGNVMSLANESTQTRLFLRDAAFKELNDGHAPQGSVEA